MSGSVERQDRQLGRLVAALSRRGASLEQSKDPAGRVEIYLPGHSGPVLTVPADLLLDAASRGLIARAGERWRPSEAGRAFLRRAVAPSDEYRRQHLSISRIPFAESATGGLDLVENESPLAWLRRRRGANGRPLVSDVQLAAGERLRLDYTRAGLMPRLGVDLTRPPSPRGQAVSANRVADSVDGALAARERVRLALGFVGGKLGSLLIDVCCELVGLEEAERRRDWPRRSGKVVLMIALDRLADHYGMSEAASSRDQSGRIRRWGTPDFRPSIGK